MCLPSYKVRCAIEDLASHSQWKIQREEESVPPKTCMSALWHTRPVDHSFIINLICQLCLDLGEEGRTNINVIAHIKLFWRQDAIDVG